MSECENRGKCVIIIVDGLDGYGFGSKGDIGIITNYLDDTRCPYYVKLLTGKHKGQIEIFAPHEIFPIPESEVVARMI